MTALAALTERMVLDTLRDDLPFAVLAPAGNFVVFNFGLRNVIDTGQMSYPQYLLPVIIVQVMLLGALTTVDRAARDHASAFGVRLRTLPISAAVPLTARMLYCLFRGTLALLAAIGVGYLFGFRMVGGVVYAAAFVILVLTLTLAVSLGADAAGAAIAGAGAEIGNSGAASQFLLVPQLLLVTLSTGMAPRDCVPRLAASVCFLPARFTSNGNPAWARHRPRRGRQSRDHLGMVPWAAGPFGALAVRVQKRTP